VLQRTIAESNAKKYDVDLIHVGSSDMEALSREKILQQVESPAFKDLVYVPKHREWAVTRLSVFVHAYNTKLVKNVPQDWPDLLKPEYKHQIGIDGDPRQATDALMAVWSASLGNGGSADNVQPGIDFFAKLKSNGNYTPARSDQAHMQTGEVAIGIFWDYLGLGFRDTFAGADQSLGTVQVQSANGTAGTAILKTEVGGVGAHSIVAISCPRLSAVWPRCRSAPRYWLKRKHRRPKRPKRRPRRLLPW